MPSVRDMLLGRPRGTSNAIVAVEHGNGGVGSKDASVAVGLGSGGIGSEAIVAAGLGSGGGGGSDASDAVGLGSGGFGSGASVAAGNGSEGLGKDLEALVVAALAEDGLGSGDLGGSASSVAEGLGSGDLGLGAIVAIHNKTGSTTIPPPGTSSFPGFVFCTKCRQEVPVHRAQLSGKSAGSWKCNACNCRMTQLNRAFGCWPPPEFGELSPKDQATFYKGANMLVDSKKVVNLAKCLLERIFSQRFVESSGGSYLPLSVYARDGYDVDRIAKECKDTMVHPVLGLVYRVAIFSKKSENESETRSVQSLLAQGKRKSQMAKEMKQQRQQEQHQEPTKTKKTSKTSSSSSSSNNSSETTSNSSSSSSDSSTDDDKKNKKAKQLKAKEKRARKAAAKAKKLAAKKAAKKAKKQRKAKEAAKKSELDERKRKKQLEADATKVKMKVGPLIAGFTRALSDELAKQVPTSSTKAAQKLLKELNSYDTEAKEILAGTRQKLSISADAIDLQWKLAKKELQLLEGFLAALRKHFA